MNEFERSDESRKLRQFRQVDEFVGAIMTRIGGWRGLADLCVSCGQEVSKCPDSAAAAADFYSNAAVAMGFAAEEEVGGEASIH